MNWTRMDQTAVIGFRGVSEAWICDGHILARWNVQYACGWIRYDRDSPTSVRRRPMGSGGRDSATWTPAEAARRLINPAAAEGLPDVRTADAPTGRKD
jgi:hypothetical protein